MALGGGSKILVVIPAQMWFHERDATRGDVLVGGGRGKRLEGGGGDTRERARPIEIA
jgi:hypothetical protein